MIEGWIIELAVLGVREAWLVKGYRHPEGGVVAVPYYRGERRLDPGGFSVNAPPWMLRRVECVGRDVPVADRRDIARIVDPSRAYKLRSGEIPGQIRELVDLVAPEWAGLTGSWAVFGESLGSDVDLLLYGKGVYDALRDLYDEGLIRPCNLEAKALKRGVPLYKLVGAYGAHRSLLDSCYKGAPYTIRVLRHIEALPCSGRITRLGYIKATVEIVDNSEKHLTPARYKVVLLDNGGSTATLESWRTRYSELELGVYRGKLEVFEDENGGVLLSPDIGGSLEPLRGQRPRSPVEPP